MAGRTTTEVDPRVTKKRVTLRRFRAKSATVVEVHEAVDYVDTARPGFLEAYLATYGPLYDEVVVSEEFDAGPGGYDGATHIPAELDHPLAGATFAATIIPEG